MLNPPFLTKIKGAYRDRNISQVRFTPPEKITASGREEITTRNLIIPGKKPLCLNISCEESYLGHLLLLTRNIKAVFGVPIIFKIMVPDVFLNSLIDSFKRNNPGFEYHVGLPDTNLKNDNVYLLGENHDTKILNNGPALNGSCKKVDHRISLSQHLEDLQSAKMQNTPIMLISNDPAGDGLHCLKELTEAGFPTVLATKCQDRFKGETLNPANMVIDINLLPAMLQKLFNIPTL